MSNKTDATKNLQTQPEERPNSTSTRNDVDMEVDNSNLSADRIRPASGRQPTTVTVWQSKKPPKAPSNESKTPKLADKMKHLQQFFELQPIELQWTMFHKTKSMIGFQEDTKFDKTLTEDLSRQSRHPMAVVSVDAAQCYDRVNHVIMSLLWLALNRHVGPIAVILSCLQTMRVFNVPDLATPRPSWMAGT